MRDKGDLQNAKLVAEQTVALLKKDTNSPDYKVAAKLLDDLSKKVAKEASTTPAQSNLQSSTAASGSALQAPISNVNVSNLNNPPQVTPAPTVKPNPKANLPQFPARGVNPTAAPQVSPAQ